MNDATADTVASKPVSMGAMNAHDPYASTLWHHWAIEMEAAECAKEPEDDQDQDDEVEDAADPAPSIAIVAVVTTAAAKQ